MAELDTYTKLASKVESFLNRANFANLTAEIPMFVEMASRRIQKEDLNAMEEIADTFEITTRSFAVPSDYDRTKTMTILLGNNNFEINGAAYKKVVQAGLNQRPQFYSVIGTNFVFGPSPDQGYTVELVYYKKLPVPSPTVPTNWVLENEPELLLWGTLIAAAKWLKDDARLAVWQNSYEEVLEDLKASESRMDKEGGGLRVTPQQSNHHTSLLRS